MRKLRIVLGVVSILLLLQVVLVLPASGITQATPDEDNVYSNVGVIKLQFNETDFLWFCSGTLIAPTVFLTAGHCMDLLVGTDFPIYVSFDKQIIDEGADANLIQVTGFQVHPSYGHDQANLYDLAVIFLPKGSTKGIKPAKVTTLGLLDDYAASGRLTSAVFASVGYGNQAFWKKGPTQFYRDGWRNYSFAPLMALTPTQMYLNINEDATEGGGACFFDSGGPVFLTEGAERTLVAVISLRGDMNCRAMTTTYRLDTSWSREFLSQYVNLP